MYYVTNIIGITIFYSDIKLRHNDFNLYIIEIKHLGIILIGKKNTIKLNFNVCYTGTLTKIKNYSKYYTYYNIDFSMWQHKAIFRVIKQEKNII